MQRRWVSEIGQSRKQGLGGEKIKGRKEGFEWELEGRSIPCWCDGAVSTKLVQQGLSDDIAVLTSNPCRGPPHLSFVLSFAGLCLLKGRKSSRLFLVEGDCVVWQLGVGRAWISVRVHAYCAQLLHVRVSPTFLRVALSPVYAWRDWGSGMQLVDTGQGGFHLRLFPSRLTFPQLILLFLRTHHLNATFSCWNAVC